MDASIIITGIIDKHLQKWIDMGVNITPGYVEPEMAGPAPWANEEGWTTWHAIASTATDDEITEIEQALGFTLPPSYCVYLKYKHFYELHIGQAKFGRQEIRGWKNHLIKEAFKGYPRQLLIDKGYIPFADWEDWGLLCFDTNQPVQDYEYPVILWDHDDWTKYPLFSDNFKSLLEKLDKLSDADAI